MKDWRVASQVYHLLHKHYSDDLNRVNIIWTEDDIAEHAIKHFYENVDEWIYPAKSYFVAICYAYWLSQDFDENFWDLLNDDDLLAGNDPHFIIYCLDIETYDKIIKEIKFPIEMKGMVPDVRKYYEDEFELALKEL
tara:strand:- start:222 stop:632 length:411 start_codon:yes stop_codon:yes gene_type:complete